MLNDNSVNPAISQFLCGNWLCTRTSFIISTSQSTARHLPPPMWAISPGTTSVGRPLDVVNDKLDWAKCVRAKGVQNKICFSFVLLLYSTYYSKNVNLYLWTPFWVTATNFDCYLDIHLPIGFLLFRIVSGLYTFALWIEYGPKCESGEYTLNAFVPSRSPDLVRSSV